MSTQPIAIKAVTEDTITVEGYGVVFGGNDLEGDTFTPATRYKLDYMKRIPVFFDHGLDPDAEKEELGHITSIEQDDTGLWMQAQLYRNRKYTDAVYGLIEQKAVGWSSGSVAHLVERNPDGTMKSWQIVEMSLTPTPAEPRLAGGVTPTLQEERMTEEQTTPAAPQPQQDMTVVVQAMRDLAEEMKAQSKQQAQAAVAEAITPLQREVEKLIQYAEDAPAIRKSGLISPDGGTADKAVRSFADYIVSIARNDRTRLEKHYKALSGATTGAGGFLIPEDFQAVIMSIATRRSVFRGESAPGVPRAKIFNVNSTPVPIPGLDYSTAFTAGRDAALGGTYMNWLAEAAARTDVSPAFTEYRINVQTLGGAVPVSNELLSQAEALEQTLVQLFGAAVAHAEDAAFFNGAGTATPVGILTTADAGPPVIVGNPALITSGLTNTVPTVAELAAMYGKLYYACRPTAIWVIHPLLVGSLLAVNATTASTMVMMPNLQEGAGMQYRLMGLPVIESEHVPATFDGGGLVLFDPQQYGIALQGNMEIAMSEHANFNNNQTVWRVTHRVGGRPLMNAPIAVATGAGNVQSGFVQSS